MQADEQAARLALRRIYEEAERTLAALPGLYCQLSGRCCRFREAGHELFCTALEYREMAAQGGDRAGAPGETCPWLVDGRCSNRDGRALACRTYFCSDEALAAQVTERFHRQIRELHARLGLDYSYQPLRLHLNPDGRISSEEV